MPAIFLISKYPPCTIIEFGSIIMTIDDYGGIIVARYDTNQSCSIVYIIKGFLLQLRQIFQSKV